MNLSSILSRITSFFSYGDRLRPTRDWFTLLGVLAVLLMGSLIWNIFLFAQLENGKPIGSSPATHTATTTSVPGVQTVFKTRATEEANYQHSYSFIDPSQ